MLLISAEYALAESFFFTRYSCGETYQGYGISGRMTHLCQCGLRYGVDYKPRDPIS